MWEPGNHFLILEHIRRDGSRCISKSGVMLIMGTTYPHQHRSFFQATWMLERLFSNVLRHMDI